MAVINGTSKNDYLTGTNYNDTFYGGAGNDTFCGKQGNDTYILNLGDGFDLLDGGSSVNTINFGSGIYQNSLFFSHGYGGDWVINYSANDKIQLQENSSSSHKDLTINFQTGTPISLELGTGYGDIYTVDDLSTMVVEALDWGNDTIKAGISYTLPDNVENLTLTGAESQEINGLTVYGNPLDWANYLDYYQGDNVQKILGSCQYVAVENLLIQMGIFEPRTGYSPSKSQIDQLETAVIKLSKGNVDVKNIIPEINTLYASAELNVNNSIGAQSFGMGDLGNYIKEGCCVAVLCDAYVLWGMKTSFQGINHAVTVTGVAYSESDPTAIEGFYICDSGRRLQSDSSRYISYYTMSEMIGGGSGTALMTTNATKQYLDNIDAIGNELDNVLTGNSGVNSLYGLGGNDTLNGAGGADNLYGGTGDDSYYVNTKDTIIELADEGNDTIYTMVDKSYYLTDNIENLVLLNPLNGVVLNGNNLNNSMIGGVYTDTLIGGLGDDTLDGATGADKMYGGLGDDTYIIDNAKDSIFELANQGADMVVSPFSYILGANLETLDLIGTANINATGNAYDNVIVGNSGDNIIDGKAGADSMSGGEGNDIYYVDNQGDTIVEVQNQGSDAVNSSVSFTLGSNIEKLVLTGYSSINAKGNDLANILSGNSGKNIIDGGLGADIMSGGAGNDTYYVDDSNDVVIEKSGQGADSVISSASYTLSANVENITLTGVDDINATGNALANNMLGNSGNNILNGAAGNDIIDGGFGADSMLGGLGNDTYYVDNVGDKIVEAFNQGTDSVYASVSFALDDNIENLTLTSSGNIDGTGNFSANRINGNSGNNVLDGGIGADTMIGGLGNDTYVVDNIHDVVSELSNQGIDKVESSVNYTLAATLENLELTGASNLNATGNIYNNVIKGNSGDNTIDGKAGADTMSGAAGSDTYIFNKGYGLDNITDTSGMADQISFGSSVNNSQIALYLDSAGELLIDYGAKAGVDKITISDWSNTNNQIEKVKLSNGKFVTNTDINKIIQDMSAYEISNGIQISNVSDVKSNNNLMSIVSSAWHLA